MSGRDHEPFFDDRATDALEQLFRDGRTTVIVAWLLIGVLLSGFVESLLDVDPQWIVFVAVAGVVVLLPPNVYKDWCVMLPHRKPRMLFGQPPPPKKLLYHFQ